MDRPTFAALRFEPELEHRYLSAQRARLLPVNRVGALAGAALMLSFGLWDRQVDPSRLGETMMIRVATTLLFLALCLVGLTRASVTAQDAFVLLTVLVIIGGISLVLAVLPDGFERGLAGLLLVMLFTGTVIIDLRVQVLAAMAEVAVPNIVMHIAGASPFTMVHANWFLVAGALSALLLAYLLDAANRRAFLLEVALAEERRRSEELLRSILPSSIVERLQGDARRVADLVEDASVLFADIVGFTALARTLPPERLIDTLDAVFTELDAIAARHGVEKIKTVGDAYMVAVGVADAAGRGVEALAEFALDARDAVRQHTAGRDGPLQLRVGLCAGPLVSGVIGRRKPHFDLWGETVNTASRLESGGVPGEIQVDESTYRRLHGAYDFEPRGTIELKGIGRFATYLLKGRRDGTQAGMATGAPHQTAGLGRSAANADSETAPDG